MAMLSSRDNMTSAIHAYMHTHIHTHTQAVSLSDYQNLAVKLLTNKRAWRRVYSALISSRDKSALWEPRVWVRDIERSLMAAWDWRVSREGDTDICAQISWRVNMAGGQGGKCYGHFAHIILSPVSQ